jgi:peptidoglycan-associated lipoprotein
MRTNLVLIMGWAAAGLMVSAMGGCGPDYPNCDNDEDCHEGEFCVNGLCQQCRDNSDCPAGQQCAAGACEAIPGYCNSAADCPAGQECRNNRCVAATESFQGQETPDTGSCQLGPIYFGFDQDGLDGAARSSVQTNVDCLRSRGAAAVHVTGYADPRGTEEYNLALGDRRSRAVADYMRSLGVGEVTQSSMGEEMASGADEDGWRRDRRVEFLPR